MVSASSESGGVGDSVAGLKGSSGGSCGRTNDLLLRDGGRGGGALF